MYAPEWKQLWGLLVNVGTDPIEVIHTFEGNTRI